MAAVADAPEHVVSIVGAFCGEVVEDAYLWPGAFFFVQGVGPLSISGRVFRSPHGLGDAPDLQSKNWGN